MSVDMECEAKEPETAENCDELIESLTKDVNNLNLFKDMFFENHPIQLACQKNDIIKKKKDELAEKFDLIDEAKFPVQQRAKFLYLKGRCHNIMPQYDPKALEYLSKAVKLDPTLVNAWNELGECYWKNFNLKEAKVCFEGALNQKRDRVTLRSLSILLRQECSNASRNDATDIVLRSVEYAKEAVAIDAKDGTSWSVLGNAYLCQFFLVAQHPATLKLSLSAYKQAWHDPIAKGHPDLHYNKGMALKYEESYAEAIESFETAHRLDPPWVPPIHELKELVGYLNYIQRLLYNKGKIKTKRLTQMVKSMEKSMFGHYAPGATCVFGKRKVVMEHLKLGEMADGENPGKVVMGKVVGSLHSNNSVPFTFAIVDESMSCVAVNVYNWADGRGVIIGDCVVIPEPKVTTHINNAPYPEAIAEQYVALSKNRENRGRILELVYNFRTIRINDPTLLRVNGKRVGMDQFACIKVTSTYEAH